MCKREEWKDFQSYFFQETLILLETNQNILLKSKSLSLNYLFSAVTLPLTAAALHKNRNEIHRDHTGIN